jgi:hypothetical protein
LDRVLLGQAADGDLDAGYVYCGLLLHWGSRVDGVLVWLLPSLLCTDGRRGRRGFEIEGSL